MNKIFEKSYSDELSAKDGGFIFQAILNYDLRWSIVDGETVLNQNDIQGWLNQVDVYPDMKFTEGFATLSYVILSEVNLLKRKFELASEAIKRIINPEYAAEMDGNPAGEKPNPEVPKPVETNTIQQESPSQINEVLFTTKLTSAQIKEINNKHFKNTTYKIQFTVDRIVLREVSTSGLDSGSPNVTLKLSTGMVDTLDGKAIDSWNGFNIKIAGKTSININNTSDPKISEILIYDPIENLNELIFRTILPSLTLEFRGDRVQIDTYSNRSTQISIRSTIDFDNLFNIEEAPKVTELGPEGEEEEEEPLNTKSLDTEGNK
jgi:hypothetical protein